MRIRFFIRQELFTAKGVCMGNLGWYQILVTAAKKVGGPKCLITLIAASGAAIYKLGEIGFNKIRKTIKSKEIQRNEAAIHTIKTDSTSKDGLLFTAGEQFKVLCRAGDIGLIEKLNDSNNPYIVSLEFISSISDYSFA